VHVTHYWLLGFFRGPGGSPPVPPPVMAFAGADDGDTFTDMQVEASNAAAIQFMMLAALAIEELH
jgi:hypothetical protein